MTPARRIALNVFVTYGRSLYALACGLFSSRWVLTSLGQVDYGLYGVVGGLVFFISFVNSLMTGAVGRFYAFSVGAAQVSVSREEGIEECRKWFNTALALHLVIPTLLVAAGYPCGLWAVRCFLAIPPDRIEMCVWVWRFSCVTCFVSMVSVPFNAMYQAKQEIAELTIYSFVSTTCTIAFLGYMVSHPSVWLVRYALGMMIIAVVPQIMICGMAFKNFEECRIRFRYFWDRMRLVQIARFAGCQFMKSAGRLLGVQGTSILVNKILGPAYNATVTIGNAVAGHTTTFSGSINGSFYPAIVNAAGEGDLEKMRNLAFRTCSFSSAVILLFAIPLVLEMDGVLRLWLAVPPDGASVLCICTVLVSVVFQMTEGCWMSVYALGRIGRFQACSSLADVSLFVFALPLLLLGVGVVGVGIAKLLAAAIATAVHLLFARNVAGMSVRRWIRRVLVPVFVCGFASFCAGGAVVCCLDASFLRICGTSLVVEAVYIPLAWYLVLDRGDRELVCRKLMSRLKR